MTWQELKAAAAVRLEGAGLESSALLARHWLADSFPGWRTAPPTLDETEVAEAQLRRLLAGEPLAYVTGVAHFYGRQLRVSSAVLIPRPETEELVRWTLEHEGGSPKRFIDACTGSGCIAVTLAAERGGWTGLAVDISGGALRVASGNVEQLGVADRVEVERRDVLTGELCGDCWAGVDVVVSNPPYIPNADWGRVAAGVAAYEPELALRVSDEEPLRFYEAIEAGAAGVLRPGGGLYFECNDLFVGAVADLLRCRGWVEVEVLADMRGVGRFVRGRRRAR